MKNEGTPPSDALRRLMSVTRDEALELQMKADRLAADAQTLLERAEVATNLEDAQAKRDEANAKMTEAMNLREQAAKKIEMVSAVAPEFWEKQDTDIEAGLVNPEDATPKPRV